MSQSSDSSGQSSAAGTHNTGTLGSAHRRRRLLAIILAVILLLVLLSLLFFFPRPTATVTLTPLSKALNNTATINIVAQPVTDTQHGTQTGVPSGPPAKGTHATGTLTFWNYTSSWVTIAAGTQVTNATGQQIVTDKDLRVPPDPIIPGVASVSAHAIKVGKSGNIAAMSINKKACCFTGILVSNEAAYSGGRDDQTLPVVRQSDLDTVVSTLKTSLTQKAVAAIQAQLKPGEQLVDATPQCTSKADEQPGIGSSTQKFAVTVSLTCSDSAYNAQTALQQAAYALKQKAAQQLGANFLLLGNIATKVEKVIQAGHGKVNVLTSASGMWRYRFMASQKQDMARYIARMTVSNAKSWLAGQTGVANVSISVSGPIIDLSGGKVIPDDLKNITMNG